MTVQEDHLGAPLEGALIFSTICILELWLNISQLKRAFQTRDCKPVEELRVKLNREVDPPKQMTSSMWPAFLRAFLYSCSWKIILYFINLQMAFGLFLWFRNSLFIALSCLVLSPYTVEFMYTLNSPVAWCFCKIQFSFSLFVFSR